jgi:hypothetical protein
MEARDAETLGRVRTSLDARVVDARGMSAVKGRAEGLVATPPAPSVSTPTPWVAHSRPRQSLQRPIAPPLAVVRVVGRPRGGCRARRRTRRCWWPCR